MGNQDSRFTPQEMQELERKTHFNNVEIKQLLQRYANYGTIPNSAEDIPIEVILDSPELSRSPFAKRLAWSFLKGGDKDRLDPEEYLMLLSVLSNKATFNEKSHALFASMDIHNEGHIRFDEFFRLYKSIFTPALSDGQIVNFVQRILEREDLEEKGAMNYQEFSKLISPQELDEKLTLDLRLST